MAKYKNINGFSLLEMTIIMVVVSLLTLPLLEAYRIYRFEKAVTTTTNNQALIEDAVRNFVANQDRFPCPADPTLSIFDTTSAVGTEDLAANGICDTAVTNGDVVAIGAVPYRALNIPQEAILDGWNNKLTYFVTTALTGYDSGSNSIDLVAAPIPTPPQGAIIERYVQYIDPDDDLALAQAMPAPSVAITDTDYFIELDPSGFVGTVGGQIAVISHGETGLGAHDLYGNLTACPTSAADAHDFENCNGDNRIFSNQENMDFSTVDGVDFYDDYVAIIAVTGEDFWSQSLSAPAIDDILTPKGVVGINMPPGSPDNAMMGPADLGVLTPRVDGGGNPVLDPLTGIQIIDFVKDPGIDVNGDILVTNDIGDPNREGQAITANEVCDETGTAGDCFRPDLVAGSGSNCTTVTGSPMTGIANENTLCNFNTVPANTGGCAANELVIGIDASGDVVCAPIP